MTPNEDWKPPLAFRPHCVAPGWKFWQESCWIVFRQKGVLLYSTKKGEGAVPLAEKQLKLSEFLIIADGRRNVSQGRVDEENSPVCDRKQHGFLGNSMFGERLSAA